MENGFEGGFLSCTVMVENLADTGKLRKRLEFLENLKGGSFASQGNLSPCCTSQAKMKCKHISLEKIS